MRNKRYFTIYIIAFVVLLVLPLAGMAVSGPDVASAEKRDLAPLPELMCEDGSFNAGYLADLGSYFEDHFGFRGQLVTADGQLKKYILGSAPGDEVIIGKSGWLYYSGTTDDYLGRNHMCVRELFDAAHNLRLMQDYSEQCGAKFLFIAAANKSTIYPDMMPDRYVRGTEPSNIDSLRPYLDDAGVRYLMLEDVLQGQDGLYFERDSHWNNKGAVIGYNAIMDALGLEHDTYKDVSFEARVDHAGDLEKMLVPNAWSPETDYYAATNSYFAFVTETDGMRDPWIETVNDQKTGALFMFRDSFADALIPFLSEEFGYACYSQYTPWNFPRITEFGATVVLCEKAERNLIDLAARPAIVPAPETVPPTDCEPVHTLEQLRAVRNGDYIVVSGRLNADFLGPEDDLVVKVSSENAEGAFVPFYSSNEDRTGSSFYMYIPSDVFGDRIYVSVFEKDRMGSFVLAGSSDLAVEPA